MASHCSSAAAPRLTTMQKEQQRLYELQPQIIYHLISNSSGLSTELHRNVCRLTRYDRDSAASRHEVSVDGGMNRRSSQKPDTRRKYK